MADDHIMYPLAQGLIDFLSQHPALALGVVFAAALLE